MIVNYLIIILSSLVFLSSSMMANESRILEATKQQACPTFNEIYSTMNPQGLQVLQAICLDSDSGVEECVKNFFDIPLECNLEVDLNLKSFPSLREKSFQFTANDSEIQGESSLKEFEAGFKKTFEKLVEFFRGEEDRKNNFIKLCLEEAKIPVIRCLQNLLERAEEENPNNAIL